jgi:hypothetical protein
MRLVSPHQSLMFAAVSGTVDATYEESWLVDGRANYPIRRTGNLSLALAAVAPQDVDVLAICHHNVEVGASIGITGDVTATITPGTYPPNGIPYNWFTRLSSPVSAVDGLTLAITGNAEPIVIGEFYVGLSWSPEVDLRGGRTLSPGQVLAMLGERGIQPPYDAGYAPPRGIRGELALDDDEFSELVASHEAQRDGSRPCLFIKDDAVNDAWLCLFNFEEQMTGGHHFVTIEILEIPRLRWPA